MNSVVNVKIDPNTKKQAQEVAESLGFTLSSLVNAYLKQLVRTKTVSFAILEEKPSEYMLNSLKESQKEIIEGSVSPSFEDANEAIEWLNDSNKKYENQLR